jgi:hypothetical protein
MKKDISFKLAVMTMVPLVVPVVMASIIHGTKKKCEFHSHNKRNMIREGLRAHRSRCAIIYSSCISTNTLRTVKLQLGHGLMGGIGVPCYWNTSTNTL